MRTRVLVGCGLGAVLLCCILALRAAENGAVSVTVRPDTAATPTVHAVTVKKPLGTPRALTGQVDHHGNPVTVACSTCHATRPPNQANAATTDLDLMHQGLQFKHGANTCLSCHDPGDYDRLRLANGNPVPCTDVMQLCAQCHGPQYRDWQHGAHGGMNGFWDLTRGGRTRNNCVDCHDPHAPKYVGAIPMPPPNDRFAPDLNHKETHHE